MLPHSLCVQARTRVHAWPGVLALWLLGLLLLASCGETRRASELPVSSRGPRADVFLRASGGTTLEIELSLAAVRLRAEDGTQVDLPLLRGSVVSSEAARRLSLAGGGVPKGRYAALSVELSSAASRRAGVRRELRLLPPEGASQAEPGAGAAAQAAQQTPLPVYEVPLNIEIGSRDAVALFLEWNVDASIVDGDGLRLALGVTQERPQASLGLLYVTDAASGTVLSVERSTGEVVGSVSAGREPRALAVGTTGARVVTANAGDGSIAVLDVRTGWTRYAIPVQLSARTSDVAVIQDGVRVAATSPGVDMVSVFNLLQLTREFDVRVGRAPVRLTVAGQARRLFVVNSASDSLSVVDVQSRAVVATLPVEREPSAVATDRRSRAVFVAHRTSQNLLVFDAETLAQVGSIPVGDEVTALVADVRRDRVYAARARPAELAVVDLGLATVTRRIRLSGRVENLAQPLEGSLVYGAAPELGALIVVNVLRGREEAPIPCGTAPSDVVTTD